MPYIKQKDRKLFEGAILSLKESIRSPGDLNYVITRLLHECAGTSPNYAKYNSLMGVLICSMLEYYRQFVVPYEDVKKEENGELVKFGENVSHTTIPKFN